MDLQQQQRLDFTAACKNFTADALSGAIGSIAGIFAGSPFDVIKTRLQTFPERYTSSLDCLNKTAKLDGPKALFRGSAVASLGQFPNCFVVFGTYGQTLRLLEHRRLDSASPSCSLEGLRSGPAFSDVFLAGAFAGGIQSLALTPFEEIKVQQQLYTSSAGKPVTIFSCAKRIVKQSGVRRGLFRGGVACFIRDSPTYGLYFFVYEFAKELYSSSQPRQSSSVGPLPVPWYVLMSAGGVSGMVAWTVGLPFDVIKSSIQGSTLDTPPEKNKVWTVGRRIFERDGLAGFTRGGAACILRSIPVNAITFLLYDSLLEAYNNR